MEVLTANNLQTAMIVLLGIAAVVVAIDKGIEAWHHLRGTDQEKAHAQLLENRFTSLEARMGAAELRLAQGDEKFDRQTADMGMVLDVLQAVLLHMYSGNDKESLKNTMGKLTTYMSNR